MRKLARVAAVLIALAACCLVPTLYGVKSANDGAAKPPIVRTNTASLGTMVSEWSERINLSHPAWLLVLGIGLIVAAGKIPGAVHGPVRPRSHVDRASDES